MSQLLRDLGTPNPQLAPWKYHVDRQVPHNVCFSHHIGTALLLPQSSLQNAVEGDPGLAIQGLPRVGASCLTPFHGALGPCLAGDRHPGPRGFDLQVSLPTGPTGGQLLHWVEVSWSGSLCFGHLLKEPLPQMTPGCPAQVSFHVAVPPNAALLLSPASSPPPPFPLCLPVLSSGPFMPE